MFEQLAGVAAEHDASRFATTAKTAKGGAWLVHDDRDPRYLAPIPRR